MSVTYILSAICPWVNVPLNDHKAPSRCCCWLANVEDKSICEETFVKGSGDFLAYALLAHSSTKYIF